MTLLMVRNHRGTELPAVLGFALAIGGAVSTGIVAAVKGIDPPGAVASGSAAFVFAAGLVDDLLPGGPRGIRGHLGLLAHGRVSTGVVKLAVVLAASTVAVVASPEPGAWRRAAGVVLVAGATNLWNGLDVRPGRAIKVGILAAPVVAGFAWRTAAFVPGTWLAAAVVLPWDLRERAMLGDAGSNLLGFAIGIAAYRSLSSAGIEAAAVFVVAMNVVADTVSLSRVIDVLPPSRWFDRLGRLPDGADAPNS